MSDGSTDRREEALVALEAAERGADRELTYEWRRYLRSLAEPERPGAPLPTPPAVLFDAPGLRIDVPRSKYKKAYVRVSDPSRNRLFAMVLWGLVTDVRAGEGQLLFHGALFSAAGRSTVSVSLPGTDTAGAAAALRRTLRLPKVPLPVEYEELRRRAERYHGLLIASDGEWRHGFELSSFADLWLAPPPSAEGLPSPVDVSVIGFVGMGSSGHLGASRGGIRAVEVDAHRSPDG